MAIKRPEPEEIFVRLRQVEVLMGSAIFKEVSSILLSSFAKKNKEKDALAKPFVLYGVVVALSIGVLLLNFHK